MSPCVICQHPDRIPERGQVCEPCRNRPVLDLADLEQAWLALSAEPGRSITDRISGTPDKPLGVKVAVLDLMLPARHVTVVRDRFGDQTGAVPVAVLLDSWVREWAEIRNESLPVPTVPRLCAWLATRVGWACEYHPAIDEFATEIRQALVACRAAMGDIQEREERLPIVPCPMCDMESLYRTPGSELVHCGMCPHLMTELEYQDEVKLRVQLARHRQVCHHDLSR